MTDWVLCPSKSLLENQQAAVLFFTSSMALARHPRAYVCLWGLRSQIDTGS